MGVVVGRSPPTSIGTIATSGDVGSSSWASSQWRSAPAHTATTTSLTVVPAARLISMISVERQPRRGDAAVGRHRRVPRHPRRPARRVLLDHLAVGRCREQPGDRRRARACAGRSPRSSRRCPPSWPPRSWQRPVGQAAGEPGGLAQLVGRRAEHPLDGVVGPRHRRPGCTWRVAGRVRVEQRRHHLGARDVVDRRHVDLGVQRDPAVRQAVDDPQLPQRPRPVERHGVGAGDEVGQLRRAAAGRRRRRGGGGTRGRSRRPVPTTAGRARAASRPRPGAPSGSASSRSSSSARTTS